MIYKNILGAIEPRATISQFGGNYGKGGYLCLRTLAENNPDDGMKWENTEEATAIIQPWAEKRGYRITISKDGHGAFHADLVHIETQEALILEKKRLEKKFEDCEHGFLRFGDVPEDGKSVNKATGEKEKGVSVFRAEFAKDGDYRPLFINDQQVGSYLSLVADNRPVYRAWGELLGAGSDGEPVIKVEKVEKLGN